MKKILILCSGNSSRSQMAEAYLNFYAKGKGIFQSAGIQDKGINPMTVKVMEEDNLDLSCSYSKTYKIFLKQEFDFLITVCDEAQKKLPATLSARKHFHFSIPDPDALKGNEQERYQFFIEIRDTVKKEILKFIGRELSETPELVPN